MLKGISQRIKDLGVLSVLGVADEADAEALEVEGTEKAKGKEAEAGKGTADDYLLIEPETIISAYEVISRHEEMVGIDTTEHLSIFVQTIYAHLQKTGKTWGDLVKEYVPAEAKDKSKAPKSVLDIGMEGISFTEPTTLVSKEAAEAVKKVEHSRVWGGKEQLTGGDSSLESLRALQAKGGELPITVGDSASETLKEMKAQGFTPSQGTAEEKIKAMLDSVPIYAFEFKDKS